MLRDWARVSEDTDRNWEVRGKYTGRAKERRALRALELSADLGDGRLELNQHTRDFGWFAAQVRVVEVSSGEAASGAECRVGVLERRLDGR